MFYYYQTIKKVNSYKERKNNSYNTEKTTLKRLQNEINENTMKTKLLTKCWG